MTDRQARRCHSPRAARRYRRVAWTSLFGCLLLVLAITSPAAQESSDADAANAEIDRRLQAHDFEGAYQAVKRLRAVLAAGPDPDAADVLRTDLLAGSFAKGARHFEEADAHFARALAAVDLVFATPAERGYHRAWALQNRADNLLELGQYRRAARLASEALETRRAAVPNDVNGMLADAMVGVRAFVNLEQWDDAMRFLGWGFELIPGMHVDRDLADINTFAVLLTQVLYELGRPDVAAGYPQEHYELAASINLDVPDHIRARLSYYRARALTDLGAFEAAIGETDRILSAPATRDLLAPGLVSDLWRAKGLAAMGAGAFDTAEDALTRADSVLADVLGSANDIDRLVILVNRAKLIVMRGAPFDGFAELFTDLAERMREEAARMSRGRTDWHEVRLRQMRFITRHAIELMADVQAGKNQPQWLGNVVAFHLAQLARFGETGAAVGQMAARASAGSDLLARTIRNREENTEKRVNAERRLFLLSSSVNAQEFSQERAELRAQIERLDQTLSSIDGELARTFPSFSELLNPTIVDWKRIGASLQPYPNEALLFYFVGERNSLLWVFNGGGVGVRHIPVGRAELSEKVRRLRQSLEPKDISRVGDIKPYDLELAHELYNLLVKPAQGTLFDARTKHLIVVPDGPLTGLPFEILVSEVPDPTVSTGSPFAAYRQAHWLGMDVAISVAPTVSALVVLREAAGLSEAPQPFLGIGDPLLSGHPLGASAPGTTAPATARDATGDWTITIQRSVDVPTRTLFRNGRGNVDALRKLPSLPETAEELTDIARSLNASPDALMLRERATEHEIRLRPDLDQFRVVAFATHGLTAGELDGETEPGLVLTPPETANDDDDGLLTASEIAGLRLDADWVILSACNTAAPDGTPGASALSGLARAFFHAGARTLLVSHWSVISDAASIYTREMLSNLARDPGMARAEAARRAKLRVMNDPDKDFYAHPLFWAPFSVVGEGWAKQDAQPSRPSRAAVPGR